MGSPGIRVALISLALGVTACLPNLIVDDSLVTAPRIVAVRTDPAEAAPGAAVQWTALYVTPNASVSTAPIQWELCTNGTPLSAAGPVNSACFGMSAPDVVSLGQGALISGQLPADTCRIFGPDPPVAKTGQPPGRPVDPDATGGYYQPFVMHTDVATLGETRINCGVAGANQQEAVDFSSRYRANENPDVESLRLGPQGAEAVAARLGQGDPLTVKAGSRNHVIAAWPTCPTTPSCGDGFCQAGETVSTCPSDCTMPRGCQGSEPYVVFDPTSFRIVDHREAIHVSWYVTAGKLSESRGGVTEANATTPVVENEWVAPTTSGNVWLWVVLVDDRGGTGWAEYQLQVVE